MTHSETSEAKLRALVYGLARVYLEIERGLRPPDQLRRILTDAEYQRHRKSPPVNHYPLEGPVVPKDIRGILLDTSVPAKLTATVTTREQGDRFGQLVMHFKRTGRAWDWKADRLERVLRPRHALRRSKEEPGRSGYDSSTPTEPDPDARPHVKNLDTRIEDALEERRLVDAARQAAEKRLQQARDEATPDDGDSPQSLRRQVGTWARRLKELDDELALIRRTKRLRERVAALDVPVIERRGATTTRDPIKKLLGPRPTEPDWSQLWDVTAQAIRDYRTRWAITDIRTALGPRPEDPSHQRERQELVELLHTAGPRLRDHCHQSAERDHALRDRNVAAEIER